MTPQERAKPELLKASRKRRIAAGAGVSVQEVNQLLNQFEQTQKMMKMVAKGGMQKMMRGHARAACPGCAERRVAAIAPDIALSVRGLLALPASGRFVV